MTQCVRSLFFSIFQMKWPAVCAENPEIPGVHCRAFGVYLLIQMYCMEVIYRILLICVFPVTARLITPEKRFLSHYDRTIIDVLPRLKPWDSFLYSLSITRPYRIGYSPFFQNLSPIGFSTFVSTFQGKGLRLDLLLANAFKIRSTVS